MNLSLERSYEDVESWDLYFDGRLVMCFSEGALRILAEDINKALKDLEESRRDRRWRINHDRR